MGARRNRPASLEVSGNECGIETMTLLRDSRLKQTWELPEINHPIGYSGNNISHECGDIHISFDEITYLPMARIAPQTQIIHNSASRNWNKIVDISVI